MEPELIEPRHNLAWLWIGLSILIVVAISYFVYVGYFSAKTSNDQTDEKVAEVAVAEEWKLGSTIVKAEATSTDTHKISDTLYRRYYMVDGGIFYDESTDGLTFTGKFPTGVVEEKGKMISNPAVLEATQGNWIMIYEMAPIRTPGSNSGKPGTSNQRDLYLAKSKDGKSFIAAGNAIDSAKADNYFASVPDLIKTPDGKIRMYYVSGGNAIGSALSSDNGVTWVREAGYRLENSAVDPDVIYKDGKWVMYYSLLEPTKNAMYKATSTDGLKWSNEKLLFNATTGGAIVDPDVFETSAEIFVMFFGQSSGGGSTGKEMINLYKGTFTGDIFK